MEASAMKFINHTTRAQRQERKRYRHACEKCRKRKRRCLHDYIETSNKAIPMIAPHPFEGTSPPPGMDSPPSLSDSAQLTSQSQSTFVENSPSRRYVQKSVRSRDTALRGADYQDLETSQSQVSAPDSNEHSSSRTGSDTEADNGPKFVGDLNPEGIFLATTRHGASEASKLHDTLGFWLPRKSSRQARERREDLDREDDANNTQGDAAVQEDQEEQPSNQRPRSSSSKWSTPLNPLRSPQVRQCLKILPAPASFNTLRAVYFKDVHPLFPILQPEIIPEMVDPDSFSPTETILAQALCLAVATNTTAQPFLRFQGDQAILRPGKFARRLSQALVTVLDKIGSTDRLLCVRVLAILSLFSQLSIDDHTSAEYCARAVSYIHTLQLHLETAHAREDNELVTQIFLCVWMLDRLNVAFHSRPLLIHARDIGRNMEACIARQEGCFRTLLTLCTLLEDVTDLYRPGHESRASSDQFPLPLFEDLVLRADAARCPVHLLATIETLYHAVAMLSYRFQSLEDPDRSSISYLRSSLSATRLITLMETEFGTSTSNFPFVPYAISLAVRVMYRELRFSKTPLDRSIARGKLLKVCALLAKFGDRYAFARRVAALASNTIKELDKVAVSVLQARQDLDDGNALEISRRNDQYQNIASHNDDADASATAIVQQGPDRRLSTFKRFDYPQIPEYDPAQYNAESFDIVHQIADMPPDLFEHFDPKFNLGVVDFALGQNVPASALPDFGFSPEDWMSASGMSSVLPDSAENYTLSSSTTL